jgi:hypothetical protein
MRSFCKLFVGAALLAGSGSAACGQPVEGACKRPIGTFHGTYTIMDGNCTAFAGRDLTLEKEDLSNTEKALTTLSDKVTTEVTLIGCTIGVIQKISDPAGTVLFSVLDGNLNVLDGDSALEGTMQYTEYMPDGVTKRCVSNVDAMYTLAGGPIGAAAQTALQSP